MSDMGMYRHLSGQLGTRSGPHQRCDYNFNRKGEKADYDCSQTRKPEMGPERLYSIREDYPRDQDEQP